MSKDHIRQRVLKDAVTVVRCRMRRAARKPLAWIFMPRFAQHNKP